MTDTAGSAYFEAAHAYDSVYLMFIDASGHSNVVSANPRDKADQAFDLLQDRILDRLYKVKGTRRCAYAEPWGWQGDGGLLVIHDDDESVARDVALEAAKTLVRTDLTHLRDEFRLQGLQGELHLRVALHKGPIRYLGDERRGSIHSPDINFAAHLEKATPQDTLAISEEVFRVAGKYADDFALVGEYEEHSIYLYSPEVPANILRRLWISANGLVGGNRISGYYERPSQSEKSRLIDTASADVVDLGTALYTCAKYLVTTERPATFRRAVLSFLERGGTYRCFLLDPNADATKRIARDRNENVRGLIQSSLRAFARFKRENGTIAEGLEVYSSSFYPGMAVLAVDYETHDGVILYSPYLPNPPSREVELPLPRGDMPHYLVSHSSGILFDTVANSIRAFTTHPGVTRTL